LVATAVLAVLQIDAFKSLEPTEARNVDGASDTAILTHALFTALDANGPPGQDNGEKPSDVQAAILTQRLRELVGGLRTAALMNEATIRATLDTGQVRRTSISQNDADVDLHRLSAGMQRTFEKPGTGRQTVWDGGPITAAINNLATTIGTWRPVKVTRVNWPDGGNLNDTIAKSVAEKFSFDQSAINWSGIGSGIGTSLTIPTLNINWEVFSASLAKGFVAELGKSGIDWDVAVTGLTDRAAANLEAATVDWTKIGLKVTETLGAKINWQDPANTISGGIADNIKSAAIDWPALVKGLVLNVNLDDFDLDPAAIREHLAHPTDAAEKPTTENVTEPRSFSPSSLFTSIPPECGNPEGSDHLVARFQYRFERSGITADDVDCVWTGDGTPPSFSRCEQDGYDTLKRAGNRPDDNGTIGAIRQKLGKTWQDEATRYQYILVAGFTDLQGPTLTNIRLSQQRAEKLSSALQSGWEWLAEGNRRPPIIAIGLGQEIDTSAASGGNMINVPGSRRAEVRMCGLPKAAQSSASALADATQGVEKPAPSAQPSKNAPKTTQIVE
jgi:hypothetical protein